MRLDQCVLGDLSRTQLRAAISEGAIRVDGKIVRIASKKVYPGSQVVRTQDIAIEALYQDESILVINKPQGIPTQPTVDPLRQNIFHELQKKHTYVGLHHRLDRDTTGVLLFTIHERANAWVADLFANRQIHKTYLAIAKKASIPDTMHCEDYLERTKKNGISCMRVAPHGQHATMDLRVLHRAQSWMLLELSPHTGRMHQIRIQCAHRGFPLLGDTLYGGEKADRIYLHAGKLAFMHGEMKKDLVVSAPLPSYFGRIMGAEKLREVNIGLASHEHNESIDTKSDT